MSNNKSIIILAAIALVAVIATLLSGGEEHQIEKSGSKVFPKLMNRINDITYIKVQRSDQSLTLNLVDNSWRLQEKNNFPANINKVRELAIGMANFTYVEPKTSKAENYAKLGVQDPSQPHAGSTQVSLGASEKDLLADIILGNSKPAKADSSQSDIYMRLPGQAQSWLIMGMVSPQWQASQWLQTELLKLKPARVKSIKVNHENGEEVYIYREHSSERNYTLSGRKASEKLKSDFELNNIASSFATLVLDDVFSNSDKKPGEKPTFAARLTTFDGLEIELTSYKQAGEEELYLSTLKASFNETVYTESKEKAAQLRASADTAADDENKAKKPAPSIDMNTLDDVRAEADRLNQSWQGWVYQLPAFRNKNIGKLKKDLLDHP